jgi:hypothetical protein
MQLFRILTQVLCVVRLLSCAPTGVSRGVRIRYRRHFFDGIDGIDPRVISMFDLHVPDSAPIHYDDLGALDHQVKAISTVARAPHRFVDSLRRSGDSSAKYYATVRTKDPDVFDRVKFRGFSSVRLPDSNEALVTLFHEKRTNNDVTTGSYHRAGLLYCNTLIRPTTAQHADPLLKPVLCVYRVAASDPDQPSTLSHRPRRSLNPLSLPSSRLGKSTT